MGMGPGLRDGPDETLGGGQSERESYPHITSVFEVRVLPIDAHQRFKRLWYSGVVLAVVWVMDLDGDDGAPFLVRAHEAHALSADY